MLRIISCSLVNAFIQALSSLHNKDDQITATMQQQLKTNEISIVRCQLNQLIGSDRDDGDDEKNNPSNYRNSKIQT